MSEKSEQTGPPAPLGTAGISFLYSYPFWIFVDRENAPSIREVSFKGCRVRLYPPFRSGPANFIPMPPIDAHAIPFIPGTAPNRRPLASFPALAVIPDIPATRDGKPSMVLNWTAEWENEPPRIFPMDSLRIDIIQADGTGEIAHEVTTRLLQLLRWRSSQWWIGRSVDGIQKYERQIFRIAESGAPLENPIAQGRGRSISGLERPVTEDIWEEVSRKLEQLYEPPIYILSLHDARYFVACAEARNSIFLASLACEQAKDLAFERLYYNKYGRNKKFRRGKMMAGNDLRDHLSRDLLKHFGRSYQQEHSAHYSLICKLWSVRNDIAHGRNNEYTESSQNEEEENRKLASLIEAAGHCVQWLETLDAHAL